ncbi:hypothetical protein E3N88_28557 [Mikania micrantha]|uniref:Uncharacterized protein n=1 Tax=Mikania micrantha TaxID=192012 RepID=A0A5N6N0T8_9ASTR|nr:hypothetical protein E3N88_28557 [Mikania micrantha]
MMNVGENRARNGVTDFPESQNEVFVEKWGKWSSRYAKEELRTLRGTRCLKISEISPDFFASKTPPPPSNFSSFNPQNLHFEGLTTCRSNPEVLKQVLIIISSVGIRQNRTSLLAPVASVPTTLKYQVSVDNTVRMHVTLVESVCCDIGSSKSHLISETSPLCFRNQKNETYDIISAMAGQGERYIYQRFPYVIVDDTPSSSSGSDSDPSEAVSLASHTSTVPPIPSLPEPVPVPPPPPVLPIIPSPPHSPPAEPVAHQRQSITPPRVPAWDGLRRMRGQARKTTGLPPQHQMAPRDEPQALVW